MEGFLFLDEVSMICRYELQFLEIESDQESFIEWGIQQNIDIQVMKHLNQFNNMIKNQFNKAQDDQRVEEDTCLVKYILSEDYDDLNMPNAFMIGKKVQDVRYEDIKRHFPLREEGQFHFRFRMKVGGSEVWLDIQNMNKSLPLFNGSIFMKVQQISTTEQQQDTVIEQQQQTSNVSNNIYQDEFPFEDNQVNSMNSMNNNSNNMNNLLDL